jgi:hypothetical protein
MLMMLSAAMALSAAAAEKTALKGKFELLKEPSQHTPGKVKLI